MKQPTPLTSLIMFFKVNPPQFFDFNKLYVFNLSNLF